MTAGRDVFSVLHVAACATCSALVLLGAPSHAGAVSPNGILLDFDGDGRDDDLYTEEAVPGSTAARAVAIARGRDRGAPQQLGDADPERSRITTDGLIRSAQIVGDVDGDRRADVALVRRSRKGARGELLVIGGRAGAETIQATPDVSLLHVRLPRGIDLESSIAPAGDVDGDGRADVLVRRDGRTLRVLGAQVDRPGPRAHTLLRVVSRAGDAGFFAVSPAGDVDGDGLGDLLVDLSVNRYCGEGECAGRTAVVHGTRRPTTVTLTGGYIRGYRLRSGLRRSPGFIVDGGESEAAGDVDGDGRDDLITAGDDHGTIAVVHGKRAGAVHFPRVDLARDWRRTEGVSAFFRADGGYPLGDTNGDGRAEIGLRVGKGLKVVFGSRERFVGTVAQRPGWLIRPPAGFTFDFGSASPAGDVNADGLSDLRVDVAPGPSLPSRTFVVLGSRVPADLGLSAPGPRGYEILPAGAGVPQG